MSNEQNNEAQEAASLLAMARDLHEKHVSAARSEANKILDEANAEASSLLKTAHAEASKFRDDLVREKLELTAKLKLELQELQDKVAKLKDFEETYRVQIKAYLEHYLSKLDEEERESKPFVETYAEVIQKKPLFTPVTEIEDDFSDEALSPNVFDLLSDPDTSAEEPIIVAELPEFEYAAVATQAIDMTEKVAEIPSFKAPEAPSFNEKVPAPAFNEELEAPSFEVPSREEVAYDTALDVNASEEAAEVDLTEALIAAEELVAEELAAEEAGIDGAEFEELKLEETAKVGEAEEVSEHVEVPADSAFASYSDAQGFDTLAEPTHTDEEEVVDEYSFYQNTEEEASTAVEAEAKVDEQAPDFTPAPGIKQGTDFASMFNNNEEKQETDGGKKFKFFGKS